MATPEDIRAGIQALLNQVPDSMGATQAMLVGFNRVRSVKGEDGEISVEKLHQLLMQTMAVFSYCILQLDNKVDKLADGTGITDGLLDSILAEFLVTD